MKKSRSLKSTIILVFGIDSLMIAIAIGRAILLERNPLRYFGEGGFITWLSIIQLLFIASKNYDQLDNIHYWFKAIEEIPKIFAEGAFIIAFYYCLIIATRLTGKAKKIAIKP